MRKVAICVGHSRSGDSGAANVVGGNEHSFNTPVAQMVAARLRSAGFETTVLCKYDGGGYTAAMVWVANTLKAWGADVAIELHFNSSDDPKSTGYEFLFWSTSTKGRALAESLRQTFRKAFPQQRDRGLKPIDKTDRGGGFLQKTHCVSVICEPFFGSNPDDAKFFAVNVDKLAAAYADALVDYLT